MDKLLEIGDFGIVRDIPSEMNILTNQNIILKQDNVKLKSNNRVLIFILVGVTAIIIYKNYVKPIKHTEDYESNDS